VRYFSRIEPFGVRLRFPLLQRDDPLALIELYGAVLLVGRVTRLFSSISSEQARPVLEWC
jgi:hypothetical protein